MPGRLLGAILAVLLAAGCAPDDDPGPAEPAEPADLPADQGDDGY